MTNLTDDLDKTPAATDASARPPDGARPDRRFARRSLFIGVPALWIAVALSHPVANVGSLYDDLRDHVPMWLGVHFAQLVLSVGLAAALRISVRGRTGPAAAITRYAIPVYLVFFAAFDSITGIASGLAIHHANTLTGQAHDGAVTTAEYLLNNRITGDVSPIWAIGQTALVLAIGSAAMAFRAAGLSRAAWGFTLAGVFAVMHAGPPAALGFALLAYGLYRADKDQAGRRPARVRS
jgi:hypothetical protein